MPTTKPHQEPLRTTLTRTGTIALIVGGILAMSAGKLSYWPIAFLLVLWPAFGGHWVELWFLNWLRPRLPASHAILAAARLAIWFIGGIGLACGMRITAITLAGPGSAHWPHWWVGGLAFLAIELAVHLALQLTGRPSFYNGRG